MRIRFVEAVAGVNFAYRPQELVDLDERTAQAFVRAGQAVIEPEHYEVAAATAPEVAVVKRGRFRTTLGR